MTESPEASEATVIIQRLYRRRRTNVTIGCYYCAYLALTSSF